MAARRRARASAGGWGRGGVSRRRGCEWSGRASPWRRAPLAMGVRSRERGAQGRGGAERRGGVRGAEAWKGPRRGRGRCSRHLPFSSALAAAAAAAEEPDTHRLRSRSRRSRSRSCSRRQAGAMGAPRRPGHENGGGGGGAVAGARLVPPEGPASPPGERGEPRPSAGQGLTLGRPSPPGAKLGQACRLLGPLRQPRSRGHSWSSKAGVPRSSDGGPGGRVPPGL